MGRSPDFKLVLAQKTNTKHSTVLGSAWITGHGGVSITLAPGVALTYRDNEDHFLTMWPTTDKAKQLLRSIPDPITEDSESNRCPDEDADIPFK